MINQYIVIKIKKKKRFEFERTINDKKKFEEVNVRAEMN